MMRLEKVGLVKSVATNDFNREVPAITREAKELLDAVRVAALTGRIPRESVIVYLCRRNRSGLIKKGTHLRKTIKENPNLFSMKPGVSPNGGRCNLVFMKPEGNRISDMLETRNEIVHPVSLAVKKKNETAPTLYILEAYFVDAGGCKHPITMTFQGKFLFLEHGARAKNLAYATEVVGEIKCLWKQCTNEILDFQSPQLVASLPHIKYLIRYVLSRIGEIDVRELQYACLLEINRLFKRTKEWEISSGSKKTHILGVRMTEKEDLFICKECKSTSCYHLARMLDRK